MTVSRIMRVGRRVEGDVGVEIEVEGKRLPYLEEFWDTVRDGSLRGEDLSRACEYVLQGPKSLPETKQALAYLSQQYEEHSSTVNDSPRCGVHVHINCQRLSILNLYNYMTLYLIFEELLVRWCGKTREGNLFCLRAQDAEYLLYVLERAAQNKRFFREFSTDNLRYASMNVNALCRYGSLEFRAMEGTKDMDRIYRWAALLLRMREASSLYENPQDIIMSSSEEGLEHLVEEVFSEEDAALIRSMDGWEDSVVEGIRRVQSIAFNSDWYSLRDYPGRVIGGISVPNDFDDDFPMGDV